MENKPEWQEQAEKLAELYGTSFVIFRNGKGPECVDSTRVVLSFDAESKRRFDALKETVRQEYKMGARTTSHRFKV